MTSPRDALRQMEADAYSPATGLPTAERDALRQMEAEAYNPPAAQSKLVTWGAVGLLLLLVMFSNQPKR